MSGTAYTVHVVLTVFWFFSDPSISFKILKCTSCECKTWHVRQDFSKQEIFTLQLSGSKNTSKSYTMSRGTKGLFLNYWNVLCVSMGCKNTSLCVENVRNESCCTDFWKVALLGKTHLGWYKHRQWNKIKCVLHTKTNCKQVCMWL